MKRKWEESNNLLHRLAEREGQCAPSGAGPSTFRRFYENVVPSVALTGIEPPTGTCIARFTPCGRYLVTFDAPANEVVLYAFMGMPGTPTLENASPEVNAPDPTPSPEASSPRRRAGGNHGIKFSDIFARHVRCGLATAAEEQLFAFCLVVHGEYLILATTAPDMRPLEPEGHWLGVSESVTFYLVELSSGEIKDKLSIRGDGLDLSHHSAASLHDDMMAVLAPGQQTIFILQVLPEGTLRMKCTLGRWCSSDDAAVALEQEQKEREESNGAREAGGQDPRDGSGAFQENWLHDSNGDGEDSEPASPPPPPSTEPVAGPFIEGIKQRMLAHMYLTALSEAEDSAATTAEGGAAAGTGSLPEAESSSAVKGSAYGLGGGVHALQTFYFYYRVYLELDMHRVQLLDRQRLLISWLPRTQASAEGGSHRTALLRGLQCVYNMETTLVEKVLGGGSQAFHDWCLANPVATLTGFPSNDWERFLAPGLWGHHLRRRDAAGTRDLSHPPGCQMRQASPYLDPELFQFDERAVTRDSLPRPLPHRASKFVTRSWPERLCFRLEADDVTAGPVTSALLAAERRGRAPFDPGPLEVLYLFHPSQPFVMAVVESTDTGMAEELTFFVHKS